MIIANTGMIKPIPSRSIGCTQRKSIIDKIDAKAIVVAIQDTVSTQDVILSSNEKEAIDQIIELLQDKSNKFAALWWSIYDQAKAEKYYKYFHQNLSMI